MLIPTRTFSPNDSPLPMRRYESAHSYPQDPPTPSGLFDLHGPRARTASSDAGSIAPSDYTTSNWSGSLYGSMYEQAAADEAALDAADAADAASAHNSSAGSQMMPPFEGRVERLSTEQIKRHPFVQELIRNTGTTGKDIRDLTQEQLQQHPYVQHLLQLIANLSFKINAGSQQSDTSQFNLFQDEDRAPRQPLAITYPRTNSSSNGIGLPSRDSIDATTYPSLFWYRSHALKTLRNNTFNLPLRKVILNWDGQAMDEHRYSSMRNDAKEKCVRKFQGVPDQVSPYKFKTYEYFSVKYPALWARLVVEFAAEWTELTYCASNWKSTAVLGHTLRNLRWVNTLYRDARTNADAAPSANNSTSAGVRNPDNHLSTPHNPPPRTDTAAAPSTEEPRSTTGPPGDESTSTSTVASASSQPREDWPSGSLAALLGRARATGQSTGDSQPTGDSLRRSHLSGPLQRAVTGSTNTSNTPTDNTLPGAATRHTTSETGQVTTSATSILSQEREQQEVQSAEDTTAQESRRQDASPVARPSDNPNTTSSNPSGGEATVGEASSLSPTPPSASDHGSSLDPKLRTAEKVTDEELQKLPRETIVALLQSRGTVNSRAHRTTLDSELLTRHRACAFTQGDVTTAEAEVSANKRTKRVRPNRRVAQDTAQDTASKT
ncbi:hypothetical protein CF319_g8984 [Tilletia indica]|nr:hypothetical protein CF319_g8984 [Tilletia indica]